MTDDTQRSACGGGATETDETIFADCFIQTSCIMRTTITSFFSLKFFIKKHMGGTAPLCSDYS